MMFIKIEGGYINTAKISYVTDIKERADLYMEYDTPIVYCFYVYFGGDYEWRDPKDSKRDGDKDQYHDFKDLREKGMRFVYPKRKDAKNEMNRILNSLGR